MITRTALSNLRQGMVQQSFDNSATQKRRLLMRAIMFLIGLFDRPAAPDCIEALCREPVIEGFSQPLVNATDGQFKHAINRLRQAGLLAAQEDRTPGAIDAHPLPREWFGEKFRQENRASWQQSNERLYKRLRDSTKEGSAPDLTALEPLFQAIPHGCKAEKMDEALNQIYIKRLYRPRFYRDPDFYAQANLGASASCLNALAWFFDEPFETPSIR